MTVVLSILLTVLLMMAAVLVLAPRRARLSRLLAVLGPGIASGRNGGAPAGSRTAADGSGVLRGFRFLRPWNRSHNDEQDAMTLAVQQMAALLKGGRNPARLWDELLLVHTSDTMGAASLTVLAAAGGAARLGAPVPPAIRNAALEARFAPGSRELRVWSDVAACLDVADSSGCPLADVLTRLAAQLEVEDDADAARQTALAGPKSTVALLGWLPLTGIGLGMALGVDPVATLLGTPAGIAALLAGAFLTIAGRVWSARLVHSAAAGPG